MEKENTFLFDLQTSELRKPYEVLWKEAVQRTVFSEWFSLNNSNGQVNNQRESISEPKSFRSDSNAFPM